MAEYFARNGDYRGYEYNRNSCIHCRCVLVGGGFIEVDVVFLVRAWDYFAIAYDYISPECRSRSCSERESVE